MIIAGLTNFIPSEIELKARMLMRRRPDVPARIPVNLELLVENYPARLELCDNLMRRHNVEGCVCRDSESAMTSGFLVLVDASIADGPNWGRYNAVLGEELSHIELHGAMLMQIRTVDDFIDIQRSNEWRQIESDARRMSLAIRLPKTELEREASLEYKRLVVEYGFGEARQIVGHLRNSLAERFRVSARELEHRSQHAGIELFDRVVFSVITRSDVLVPSGSRQPLGITRQLDLFDHH